MKQHHTYPVMVFGDVMLDKYYRGSVNRISPEAPVPVVHVNQTTSTLGGSANVAHNLATLGISPMMMGLIGHDTYASELIDLAQKAQINFLPIRTKNPTITKIRVIGEHQQIARLDFESQLEISSNIIKDIRHHLDNMHDIKVLILSDYNKGALSSEICQILIDHFSHIPILVDPKGHNWDKYIGAFLVTPNVKEVEVILGRNIPNSDDSIEAAGKEILNRFGFKHLLITRSEKGMTLFSTNTILHLKTQAREVYDVSGAGDTVIAALAWSLVKGYQLEEAAQIANLAAGIAVGKLGTAPVYAHELLHKLYPTSGKIMHLPQLLKQIDSDRKAGHKIVFTNGCFDILHCGHTSLLKSAKNLGDKLIVAVNSDRSVRMLKGPSRPVNNEKNRAELLSYMDFIDYIILFNEKTPYKLLKKIKPHILVKGGDYNPDDVVGKEFAEQVKIIPFLDGFSTTSIINKINQGE